MRTSLAPRPVTVLAFLAVASLALAAPAQDKVKLTMKGTVGETLRRKNEVALKFEAEGQKLSLEQQETVLVTVKEVKADGSVVLNHKVESQTRSVNGEKVPAENDDQDEYTATQTPDGRLVAYEEKKPDPDDKSHLNERLFVAGTVVFSPNAVGKGETWKIDFAPNGKLGLPKAEGKYKLEAIEDVDGVKCAKVKLEYRELEGKAKLEYSGTTWIELSSGDEVKASFEVRNVEFGPEEGGVLGIASGTSARASGSPVKGAQGAKANDAAAAKKDEEDTIDKKVKDFEKLPGLFTLYKRTKDNRQQVYLEIREDQLDKLMMLQATAATGSGDGRVTAGDPISDTVFSFKKMPTDKLYLTIPNYAMRAGGDKTTQVSVERAFPDQYVESFRIEAKQPDRKSVLIDISNFLLGDFFGLGQAMGGISIPGLPIMGGAQADRERSFISQVKSFPTNVFAQTTYVFPGRRMGGGDVGTSFSGDGRGVVVKLNLNLFALPTDNGFQPRMYDPRVGFFTTDYMDFAQEKDMEKREQLILRWNLKKKNPSAAVSEPVEPIVFWLDNAIPEQWRPTVSAAITQWNGAFEKAGFKNAIVVKQMPDNADFDSADMRYNVVRWDSSPSSAYAVALFRHNPITGQILNASITVDSNMVRFTSQEQDLYSGLSRWMRSVRVEVDPKAVAAVNASQKAQTRRNGYCDYAEQAVGDRDFGYLAATMSPVFDGDPNMRTTYIKQFLMEVVGHEMGHILGLRHNFVASTELSYDELGDPAKVAQFGNSASLMDYLPFNAHGLESKQIPFYSQTLGTYDKWAIAYGYQDLKAIDKQDEARQLRAWASQTNEPGKRYMGDEFADGVDPYVIRFDSSKDPVRFLEAEAELSRRLLKSIGDRYPKQGESYFSFTRAFNQTLNSQIRTAVMASSFLGGVRKNPNFKGDGLEQPTISTVDAASQRRALAVLTKNVFDKDAFAFPKKYFTKFTVNPKASYAMSSENDFPIMPILELVQRMGLAYAMSPDVLTRLVDQEFKSETSDTLTARELLGTVDKSVWSELSARETPTMLRRSLQRSHIDALVALANDGSVSGEIRQMARTNLRGLATRLKAASATGEAKDHYEDSALRITKFLEAKPVIRP